MSALPKGNAEDERELSFYFNSIYL